MNIAHPEYIRETDSRTSNSNIEKPGNSKYGRRRKFNRKCKPSITSNAIYRTHGVKENTFRITPRKRTELTNIVKDGKTFLSDWSELSVLAPTRPKIPIYVGRDADGEITNHIVMARTKGEEKQTAEGTKSPKKKNKKSLEGKFQNKIQTAISGTENTVKTDTGKIIRRKFISDPLFQTEKKSRREQIPLPENEIQPKNRHCLRGLDGKYGRWDEILRDILNGKLKIVQNRKKTETDTEEEDDEDDKDMPETTERETYDTSERNGSYVPIRCSATPH